MDKENRNMSIGVMVRDGKGEVFTTLSAPKATAALQAANFCKELGLQRVIANLAIQKSASITIRCSQLFKIRTY